MEPQNPTPAAIENLKELIAELDRIKDERRVTEHSRMAYLLANNAKVLIQHLEENEREVKGRPSEILAIHRIIQKYGDNGYLINQDIDKLIPLLRTVFSS